jgi:hypothetical protein
MENAGFTVIDCLPHALGRASRTSASDFFERVRRVARIASAASGLPSDSSVLESCIDTINREAGNVGSATVGYGCHLVPVFVSVADKEP